MIVKKVLFYVCLNLNHPLLSAYCFSPNFQTLCLSLFVFLGFGICWQLKIAKLFSFLPRFLMASLSCIELLSHPLGTFCCFAFILLYQFMMFLSNSVFCLSLVEVWQVIFDQLSKYLFWILKILIWFCQSLPLKFLSLAALTIQGSILYLRPKTTAQAFLKRYLAFQESFFCSYLKGSMMDRISNFL